MATTSPAVKWAVARSPGGRNTPFTSTGPNLAAERRSGRRSPAGFPPPRCRARPRWSVVPPPAGTAARRGVEFQGHPDRLGHPRAPTPPAGWRHRRPATLSDPAAASPSRRRARVRPWIRPRITPTCSVSPRLVAPIRTSPLELEPQVAAVVRVADFDAVAARDALPLPERGRHQAEGVEHVHLQRALQARRPAGHVERGDARLVLGVGLHRIHDARAGARVPRIRRNRRRRGRPPRWSAIRSSTRIPVVPVATPLPLSQADVGPHAGGRDDDLDAEVSP